MISAFLFISLSNPGWGYKKQKQRGEAWLTVTKKTCCLCALQIAVKAEVTLSLCNCLKKKKD